MLTESSFFFSFQSLPKPKGAKTAYIFFCDEKRGQVKAANPEAKFGEISKLIAEAWKALDEEARKPYVEKAKVAKQRYEDEMRIYRTAKQNTVE